MIEVNKMIRNTFWIIISIFYRDMGTILYSLICIHPHWFLVNSEDGLLLLTYENQEFKIIPIE